MKVTLYLLHNQLSQIYIYMYIYVFIYIFLIFTILLIVKQNFDLWLVYLLLNIYVHEVYLFSFK